MKKFLLIFFFVAIFFSFGGWLITKEVSQRRLAEAVRAEEKARVDAIAVIIDARRPEKVVGEADPFGEDGIVRVLLIGLDKRAGQVAGHCDVIQLVTIDKTKQNVTITAVPRGTYSPLPPGKGATSSDYYVSNACGLVGLDYGITQIEKILGQKADYLVVVGFSETLGILRKLKLPTTETLQWLRQRQGYQIGEPQRARNHSTFLKQLLTKYIPAKSSKVDQALQYIIYKIVQTNLSFPETRVLVDELSKMDLTNHPERIQLAMRPAYNVQDIPYDPTSLDEYRQQLMEPIKNWLDSNGFEDVPPEVAQAKLLDLIDKNKENPEFSSWAWTNDLWQQIEDDNERAIVQYDFLVRHLATLTEKTERQSVIADYILEMEYNEANDWAEKGRLLLEKEIKTTI